MDSVLSRTVRVLRQRLSLTQAGLGELLGKTSTTILRYESSRPPRDKALIQLRDLATNRGERWLAVIFDRAFQLQVAGHNQEDLERELAKMPVRAWEFSSDSRRSMLDDYEYIWGETGELPPDRNEIDQDEYSRSFAVQVHSISEVRMLLALRGFLRTETEPSVLLAIINLILRPYAEGRDVTDEIADIVDSTSQIEKSDKDPHP